MFPASQSASEYRVPDMNLIRKQMLIGLALFSLAIASAAETYRVDLYQTTNVNGTEFKRGECKVELKDGQVVVQQGKKTAEAAVQVERSPDKYMATAVAYTDGNQIQEIRLGSTNMKLVFSSEPHLDTQAGK